MEIQWKVELLAAQDHQSLKPRVLLSPDTHTGAGRKCIVYTMVSTRRTLQGVSLSSIIA